MDLHQRSQFGRQNVASRWPLLLVLLRLSLLPLSALCAPPAPWGGVSLQSKRSSPVQDFWVFEYSDVFFWKIAGENDLVRHLWILEGMAIYSSGAFQWCAIGKFSMLQRINILKAVLRVYGKFLSQSKFNFSSRVITCAWFWKKEIFD